MVSIVAITWLALGAPPEPRPEDPPDAPVVDVEGTRPSAPEIDPASAGDVLRPSALPASGAGRSVGDLVRHTPGVVLQRDGGIGSRESVSLRGTDAQQALVVLDGVRLNPPLGGGVDLGLLPLAAFDRVEVYRGGGGALFGTDALGGAIRLVPRFPAPGATAEARVGGGTLGWFEAGGTAGYGWRSGHAGLVGTFLHRQARNDFSFVDTNGRDRTREHAATRLEAGMLSGGADLGHLRLRGTAGLSYAFRELPGVEQQPSTSAEHDTLSAFATASVLGRDVGVRGLSLRGELAWASHQSRVVDPQPAVPPAVDVVGRSHSLTAAFETLWYAPHGHTVRARLGLVADLAHTSRLGGVDAAHARVVGSTLLADEWAIGGSDVTLQGVVRVDASSRQDTALVPRLAVLWEPAWENVSLSVRAGAGRAYRLPSFDELYFDTGAVRGNAALRPEDAWSFDAGVSLTFGAVRLAVDAFHLRIENLVLFLPTTLFSVRADDSQGARSSGLELRVGLGPVGLVTFEGRYTFTNARFRDSERRLPGRPRHTGGLRTTLRWGDAFTVWLELEGQDGAPLDRFEALMTPARFLVHAGAEARIGPHLAISLEASNLTNVLDAVDSIQQPLPGARLFGAIRFNLYK